MFDHHRSASAPSFAIPPLHSGAVHTVPLPWGARIEIVRDEIPTEPDHDPVGTVAVGRPGAWILRRPGGIRLETADWSLESIPAGSVSIRTATDEGALVVAYATAEDRAREGFEPDSEREDPGLLEALEADCDTWLAYLAGDVYGWILAGADGSTMDSCWGYYGKSEIPYMVSAAREAYRQRDASRAAHRLIRGILPRGASIRYSYRAIRPGAILIGGTDVLSKIRKRKGGKR